jgi:DNA-binding NtrC family response regulator
VTAQIDLGARVRNREPLANVLAEVERTLLAEALRQTDSNHDEAARRLGLTTDEFEERLATLG